MENGQPRSAVGAVAPTRGEVPLLADATAIVVGGSGNVGRHIVSALLQAGATVIVPSRSEERIRVLRGVATPEAANRLVTLIGDFSDENDSRRLRESAIGVTGRLDGVVASLGSFVPVDSVLKAPRRDLDRVLEGYVTAHLTAAQALIPTLEERGGSYVFINGPLAFAPLFHGGGLVSIATAAQAMLARVLAQELAESRARVNELVIYSAFGWGRDDQNAVSGAQIGRYVAYLLSPRSAGIRGQTIHLKSQRQLDDLL
jgi:NAD(P)-dependent dehydrogenase (short-subunit alcohol dehydrogenase family)